MAHHGEDHVLESAGDVGADRFLDIGGGHGDARRSGVEIVKWLA